MTAEGKREPMGQALPRKYNGVFLLGGGGGGDLVREQTVKIIGQGQACRTKKRGFCTVGWGGGGVGGVSVSGFGVVPSWADWC